MASNDANIMKQQLDTWLTHILQNEIRYLSNILRRVKKSVADHKKMTTLLCESIALVRQMNENEARIEMAGAIAKTVDSLKSIAETMGEATAVVNDDMYEKWRQAMAKLGEMKLDDEDDVGGAVGGSAMCE